MQLKSSGTYGHWSRTLFYRFLPDLWLIFFHSCNSFTYVANKKTPFVVTPDEGSQMIGGELKRGRHLLVTVGRYAVVAAVACVLLILLYQTRHLYQQYVRLEKIKSNNFEVRYKRIFLWAKAFILFILKNTAIISYRKYGDRSIVRCDTHVTSIELSVLS